MPEEDGRIFSDFFNIWKKYREKKLTDTDWMAFGDEVAACAMLRGPGFCRLFLTGVI